MSCFSLEVSDETCFYFLGSDFNLFVGLDKVFKCQTYTPDRGFEGSSLAQSVASVAALPGLPLVLRFLLGPGTRPQPL